MLHIQHRPDDLSGFIGNKSTKESLEVKFADRKRLPHTFLITGPSGCGKTTLGRIISNMLGTKGVDRKEMNTADFRGIDTAREIIQLCRTQPFFSPCRTIMFDECHKLTPDAQEALLKILEEAPKSAYFILATTNPEKLKKTLRRRCFTLEVKLLSEEKLAKYLNKILVKEEKEVPEEILNRVVSRAEGSLGMALMMLNKVIDMPEESMASVLDKMEEEEKQTFDLCRTLLNGNWKSVVSMLHSIQQEPEDMRRMILGYFNSMLLNSGSIRAYKIIKAFSENYYDSGKAGLSASCFRAVVLRK